jgi:hypothetical protein
MKSGDRVTLSPRGIKAAKATRGGKKFSLRRHGTIYSANNNSASVIWDGRTSLDKIPIAAVELCRTKGNADDC